MLHPETGLDRELKRIRDQEDLDSIELLEEGDQDVFDELMEFDLEDDQIRDSIEGWVIRRLNFQHKWVHGDRMACRYEYSLGGGNSGPTLLSTPDFVDRMERAVDREAMRQHRLPVTWPLTYSRNHAWKRSCQLLRIGHPFLDGIMSLTRRDDRGIAYAMWRCVQGYPPALAADLFFRFDFLVEADSQAVLRRLASDSDSLPGVVHRRADAAFPPIFQTVWLDSDMAEVTDPDTLKFLKLPYEKHRRDRKIRDFHLSPTRWSQVDSLGLLSAWAETCQAARRAGEALLRKNIGLREHCEARVAQLMKINSEFVAHFESRIARLDGEARKEEERARSLEETLTRALIDGIRQPTIRPDSVGAVFLSNLCPFDKAENE
jgi:ATP-dependent helicase HepA